MNICAGGGILSGMDISVLTTTNDIEKLRAMALARVIVICGVWGFEEGSVSC
ncbi:hypothetical protein DJ252_20200 [Salmonella enterica subsp. enterica serovar Uzaramo]|nr:hypothetical protein [Salmonella enterica subsp. enterica serovar Uzaramo]EEG5324298.1 hypothetical protein [Salmonella enterica]